jgi:DNA mismatch endonuclease (patch repair protein)
MMNRIVEELFVHGCFWHGHGCARGARVPKQNRAYWVAKVARNRVRDAAARRALRALGWRVVTVWECDLRAEAKLERRLAKALNNPSPVGEGGRGAAG